MSQVLASSHLCLRRRWSSSSPVWDRPQPRRAFTSAGEPHTCSELPPRPPTKLFLLFQLLSLRLIPHSMVLPHPTDNFDFRGPQFMFSHVLLGLVTEVTERGRVALVHPLLWGPLHPSPPCLQSLTPQLSCRVAPCWGLVKETASSRVLGAAFKLEVFMRGLNQKENFRIMNKWSA